MASVEGGFEPGRQPYGNSIFLDAPEGLILIDTGRHPAHQQKLLAYAKARGRRSRRSSTATGISIIAAAMPRSGRPFQALRSTRATPSRGR
jgi:hypothetical protein